MNDQTPPPESQPQPTQPRGIDEKGNPYPSIDIPIPKKKDVMKFLKKSAKQTSGKNKK